MGLVFDSFSHSVSFAWRILLLGEFIQFTFKAIIDVSVPIAIFLIVWG